jgi:hypothetical protein
MTVREMFLCTLPSLKFLDVYEIHVNTTCATHACDMILRNKKIMKTVKILSHNTQNSYSSTRGLILNQVHYS